MRVTKLFRIDDRAVFYNSLLGKDTNSLRLGLEDGTCKGYDIDDTELEVEKAIDDLIYMANFMQQPMGLVEAIYRNMEVAKLIITNIKATFINLPVLDGISVYNKLKEPIAMIGLHGSFYSAILLLQSIEIDDNITAERISNWCKMLESADAIDTCEG